MTPCPAGCSGLKFWTVGWASLDFLQEADGLRHGATRHRPPVHHIPRAADRTVAPVHLMLDRDPLLILVLPQGISPNEFHRAKSRNRFADECRRCPKTRRVDIRVHSDYYGGVFGLSGSRRFPVVFAKGSAAGATNVRFCLHQSGRRRQCRPAYLDPVPGSWP